jgi:uncharacterized membrane protein YedE/YeeE
MRLTAKFLMHRTGFLCNMVPIASCADMKDRNLTPTTCDTGNSAEKRARWNPYLVGVGIGVLSWSAFGLVNQPLGISTALSSTSSACALPFMGSDGVAQNAYWTKHPLQWDSGTLFLVGTFLGSALSVLLSRTFCWEKVPSTWSQQFGPSALKRMLAAFVGGVIIMYGARMAGGCTSGHGISGSLQLAVSSWTFFLTMFVAGIATALILFRRRSKPAQ